LETTYAPTRELRYIKKTQNEGSGILEPMSLIQEILLRKPLLKYLKLSMRQGVILHPPLEAQV